MGRAGRGVATLVFCWWVSRTVCWALVELAGFASCIIPVSHIDEKTETQEAKEGLKAGVHPQIHLSTHLFTHPVLRVMWEKTVSPCGL